MPAPLHRLLNPTPHPPSPPPAASPPPTERQSENKEMVESAVELTSYKRAPKACTECRSDKTRCEIARPCSSCVKRGRKCVDGCLACRRDRMKCDGDRPCAACLLNGRECVEDDIDAIAVSKLRKQALIESSPAAVASTLESPTTSRSTFKPTSKPTPAPKRKPPNPRRSGIPAYETRIKVACIACRRDNAKCGGGRACPRCMENDEKCIYISRARKIIKKRCARCRTKNKKCEDVRPCQHCVNAEANCIDLPRKGGGRGLRVKKACEGCRKDKIRCEETRPCGRCVRQGVACVERDCSACTEETGERNQCRGVEFNQSESHGDDSDSDSGGEAGGPSTPPLPSPSPPLSRLVRLRDAQPSSHVSQFPRLPPPPKLDYSHLYPPTFATPQPPAAFPASPSTHPMRPVATNLSYAYAPDVSFLLSSGSYASLSLATAMSDVRTYAYD